MKRDPDEHRPPHGTTLVGVSRFCRIHGVGAAFVVAAALAVPACGGAPEALVPALDAALAAGDRHAVAVLLTADSRALLDALLDVAAPDGAATGMALHAPQRRSEVVERSVSADGAVVLKVRDGQREVEWVVRREAGAWRLDLVASASRIPFFGL